MDGCAPNSPSLNLRRVRTVQALVLAAIVGMAYAGGLHGTFVLDDFARFVDNPFIRNRDLVGALRETPARALPALTFYFNTHILSASVAGFHLVNLLLHVANALLVWRLVAATLALGAASVTRRAAEWTGFAAALVWAVHPLQSQAVMYVAQRSELMVTGFYLGALYTLCRSIRSARGAAAWLAATVGLCGLGMLSKEVMVTAPVALLIYLFTFAYPRNGRAWMRTGLRALVLMLPWGLLAAAMASTWALDRHSVGFHYDGITPWQYALTQVDVVSHYLSLLIAPRGLCFDYAWPRIESPAAIIPECILLGSVILVSLLVWLRNPRRGFPLALAFLMLAPTSSIVPVADYAFEHRMYGAAAAFIWFACDSLRPLVLRTAAHSRPARLLWPVAFATLVIWLAGQTCLRTAVYESELTLWADVVAKRPANFRARNNLATALAGTGNEQMAVTLWTDTVRDLEPVVVIDPDPARWWRPVDGNSPRMNLYLAHANLARYYETQGALNEAVHHLRKARDLMPFRPELTEKLDRLNKRLD